MRYSEDADGASRVTTSGASRPDSEGRGRRSAAWKARFALPRSARARATRSTSGRLELEPPSWTPTEPRSPSESPQKPTFSGLCGQSLLKWSVCQQNSQQCSRGFPPGPGFLQPEDGVPKGRLQQGPSRRRP